MFNLFPLNREIDRMECKLKDASALLFSALFIVTVPLVAFAQEVNGIYTDSTTKDLGSISKVDALKGIKFRGWLEGYYVFSANRLSPDVANANQGSSAVKSRDLTIEGRTFDVHNDTASLNLAELEVEKIPERGSVGFKFDMAFGDTQDIIVDTIKSVSANGVSLFDKTFQHASISYMAPVGQGLRFDFGKFVTHIGGETIESIKNRNFSHAFFYTYGIPFQDTGLRVNYTASPTVYFEFYGLNGWNMTTDNNRGKSVGASIGVTPNSKFSMIANYLGGPEQNGNNHDLRHLGDFQFMINPTPKIQTMINVDVAKDSNALGAGSDASWSGVTVYVRPNIHDRFFPTFRGEWYNDPGGFTTGVRQHLWGYTFTGDYKLGKTDDFAHILLRPEFRYDKSSANFFGYQSTLRTRDHQLTVGVGLVAYF